MGAQETGNLEMLMNADKIKLQQMSFLSSQTTKERASWPNRNILEINCFTVDNHCGKKKTKKQKTGNLHTSNDQMWNLNI